MGKNVSPGTALITGGSSGIGYAIARELAGRGYKLILVSNQEERLREVCDEFITKFAIEARPVFMDLSAHDAAINLYNWCHKEHLEIDVLVNNAGVFFFGEVVETAVEKIQRMISLHVYTTASLCTLFGMDMKQRRSGHILNISSLAAYMPYPGIACYNSTKSFLKNFSRSLRTEMIDYHVNVTCICPGAVSTELYNLNDRDRKTALKTGIMMRPEKLARKIVNALFKKKATYIPGFLNKISLFFIWLVPHWLVVLVRRHSRFLPPDKQEN
ncbi:MAG TPA: SDR family oxidoreductase [Bacteroidales bacterium]|nr:SDR family oxidoreductase [Bacteroidales bacterium]